MSFIDKVKIVLVEKLISLLSRSNFFIDRFFSRNRGLLVKENFEFPSVINNGYIHIERITELAHKIGRTENKIIVDAGASTGIMTKMFAERFPELQIYCFEPIQQTFKELTENTAKYKNLILINKALGSSPGLSVIHILDRISSSSILSVSEKIDDPYFAEALKEKKTENITISTLDIEIPSDKNIAIMKMDVQGFELEILKGGQSTLRRTDLIVLEMQNHDYYRNAPMYYDLDKFLREQHFVCWDIIPSLRKEFKLKEWDAIYVSERFIKEFAG